MMFAANVMLAILWAALIGPFSPTNVGFGFLIGYVMLSLIFRGRSSYTGMVPAVIALCMFTISALVVANLRVAYYTVTPLRPLRPAILRVPLEENMSDTEITLLSLLITLTPGTLTLDVAPDRTAIFVHFMHVDNPDAAIHEIKHGFERRILLVTR